MFVRSFDVDIEVLQYLPYLLNMRGLDILDQRFVVFIDKDNHFAKVFGLVDQLAK